MGTQKSRELKQTLVKTTYALILEGGFENVKVRRLAELTKCNTVAIYRYFGSLDRLIYISCFEFLNAYNIDITTMMTRNLNPVDNYIASWKVFLTHAFRHPPVFIHLFFGEETKNFRVNLLEHFDLFPEEYAELHPFSSTVTFTGDLVARDYFVLHECANQGYLRVDDAFFISRVNSMIVRAMLLDHLKDYVKPGVSEAAANECCAVLERILDKFLIHRPSDG